MGQRHKENSGSGEPADPPEESEATPPIDELEERVMECADGEAADADDIVDAFVSTE